MKSASHVDAPMNYLDIDSIQEKPAYYLYTPPTGVPQRNTKQIKTHRGDSECPRAY